MVRQSVRKMTINLTLWHRNFISMQPREKTRQTSSTGYSDFEVIDSRIMDGVLKRKVRYVGYGEKYDEWLPALDVVRKSTDDPTKFSQNINAALARIKIRTRVSQFRVKWTLFEK